MNKNQKCYCCGSEHFSERHIRYIYHRNGNSLYVPDMPADVCDQCGMIYYHGEALLKVEQRFKAIYQQNEQPDRYTTLHVMDYA